MSYKGKYNKYKLKYLRLKQQYQTGGTNESTLTENVIDNINKMHLDELMNFDLDSVTKHIRNLIMETKKIGNEHLLNFETIAEIGSGFYGTARKLKVKHDLYKNNVLLLRANDEVLGKYIKVDKLVPEKTLNIVMAEVIAHSTVTLTDCGLPQIYGYFENVTIPNDPYIYYLILSEFVNGTNMLNEIMQNNYSIHNLDNINMIMKWVNDIDTTLQCLHKHDIAHRDVKLDNVIIRKDTTIQADGQTIVNSKAVLIDYGLTCKYLTFCSNKNYVGSLSPIKRNMANDELKSLAIEKQNDYYGLGILILDALSKMIEMRATYQDKTFLSNYLKTPLGEKYDYINNQFARINEFINTVNNINITTTTVTNKALEYIKKGLSWDDITRIDALLQSQQQAKQAQQQLMQQKQEQMNAEAQVRSSYSVYANDQIQELQPQPQPQPQEQPQEQQSSYKMYADDQTQPIPAPQPSQAQSSQTYYS
ncbi:serine/threonine-protein kinase [Fadolivirus algeromassiliense]|jgi:serine/threonine protein kinase|uniref:Serine/threonine-protein kinase n=1 Tax=Fadolivirus FV1/VV64 TaxID=3070911 RepID=A0A7D3QVL7_9VIRU|nr:serine/threonine-protein kinase [Fadolivirus algeromassiliense]QKF93659.1 serine/threonine-protein kinase [Fadolivirus FV1/VV64]